MLFRSKGKVSMESVFNQDKIKDGEDNTLEIDINGKKIKKKVHIKKPGKIDDEILAKWPNRISDNVN